MLDDRMTLSQQILTFILQFIKVLEMYLEICKTILTYTLAKSQSSQSRTIQVNIRKNLLIKCLYYSNALLYLLAIGPCVHSTQKVIFQYRSFEFFAKLNDPSLYTGTFKIYVWFRSRHCIQCLQIGGYATNVRISDGHFATSWNFKVRSGLSAPRHRHLSQVTETFNLRSFACNAARTMVQNCYYNKLWSSS